MSGVRSSSTAPPDWPALIAAARARLTAGDASGAEAIIETAGPGDVPSAAHWLLAQAARRSGDERRECAALDAILAAAPRDIPALIARGHVAVRAGDDRAAMRWFSAALAQANAGPPVPAHAAALEQAARYCAAASARFAEQLDAVVSNSGLFGEVSDALRHAIAMVQGRAALYLQHPSMFYYPGLAQRPFFDARAFDWVPAIEAAAPAIRDELDAVFQGGNAFAPYVERSADGPAPANPLIGDPAWSAAYLWRGGAPALPLAAACPAAMAALAKAPMPVVPGRAPMALFSRLAPGAHIRPHHGLLNTRLICHLPLVAPDGCTLRVGAETRDWRFGELLIFDDSIEHEAWNRGTADRTILLFEIWRPDIPAPDRALLTQIFAGILDPGAG